jgi:sulfatase maturation enzyme AslB (radical SAM superfamily)
MVTNKCNLSCSHCNVLNSEDNYNEEIFLSKVSEFEGRIILFGGEPSLYIDRIKKLIECNDKITSISTNLLILNNELINIYKTISISTSWNPTRFDIDQYQTWLSNLKILEENNITCTVMITMDEYLIDMSSVEFMNIMREWDQNYKAISSIKLEHLVSTEPSQDFSERVDDWLCELYSHWDIDLENQIFSRVDDWIFNCNMFTLYPDGTLRKGCPHQSQIYVPSECFNCNLVGKCSPCRLQKFCTYPKKLSKLVRG